MKAKRQSVTKKSKVTTATNMVSDNSVVISKISRMPSIIKSLIIFILIAGLLYYFRGLFVVAVVNGKPITRFEVIKELEEREGNSVLDELITVSVIESEARKAGITVTEKEIDEEQNSVNSQLSEQGTTLEEALAGSGQTMESARKSFRIQKLVEKLLGDRLIVSDEEVKAYFDEYKDSFGEDASFEELKEDLKSQLIQQKMGVEFEKWIAEKKGSSKVIFFKDFN